MTQHMMSKRVALAGVAAPVAFRGWLALLTLAGRIRRPPVERWRSLGGGACMAIAPHPDDETAGWGGVLIGHRRAGDRVVVVPVTDGRGSRAGGLGPAEMAARRAVEAQTAATCLDVELRPLDFPEFGWHEAQLTAELRHLLAELSPDVLYVPSPVDYHPGHVQVARSIARALPEGNGLRVRIGELGVPLTPTLTNLVADVTPYEDQRRAALRAYVSQAATLRHLDRARRYNAAFWGVTGYVECYWEVTADQYRAICATGIWSRRHSPYRGWRQHPIRDLSCYLQGQRERRRLVRAARQARRDAAPTPKPVRTG